MKQLMLVVGVIAGFVFANQADVTVGVVEDNSYSLPTVQINIPENFNPQEIEIQIKEARKNGEIKKANELSEQLHQWWLNNRTIEIHPATRGSNLTPGPDVKEEYRSDNNPSPLWTTDIRIDPHDEVYGVKIASLSNGHIYAIAVWDSSGQHHILVRRSTNHGYSWTTYWNHNFTSSYYVFSPGIRIINDTIVMWYILQSRSSGYERTWFRTCLPGASDNCIYYGSPTGDFNDRYYYNLDLTDDSPIYASPYLYATWTTENTTGTDTTWVCFARSNELNVGTWEIGPINLENTVGNNIYFRGTKIAYGSDSDRMWLTAWLHPYGYPSTYDRGVFGWYSTNYGSTWSSYVDIASTDDHLDQYDHAIAGAHSNTNWVLLATQADTTGENSDIYNWYSTNDGANWTSAPWVVPYLEFLPSVYVDNNSTAFYACFRQDLTGEERVKYKVGSISNPNSWTESVTINDITAHDLSGVYGPSVSYNPAIGDAIIAWTDLEGGWYSIWFDTEGAWGINEGETHEDIERRISLNIVPNPSNGITHLSYTLRRAGNVKAAIYDASGRAVRHVVNAIRPAGTYTINLDNHDLPNGIYFVKLETSDGTATKSMTVVK